MQRILLDAMGGDNSPACIIEGATLALKKYNDIEITLIGKRESLERVTENERLHRLFTTEVIEMEESPVNAVRTKKDSSMVVGMNMLKDGEADAFVTAGSTGAVVAGGTLIVRRLPGIERPALGAVIPSANNGKLMLIDCGANVDCKPSYLRQFGIMGSIYMNKVMGVNNPGVCLINNGTEEVKGNAQTKESYQLLKNTKSINFLGNAEGRDLLSGKYDVAVCDGFVGNVFMKAIEGFADVLFSMLKESLMSSKISKIGAFLSKGAFSDIKKQMDYSEYGGAPLLGVNGCLIKAHGSSDAKAICNAIGQAYSFNNNKVLEKISSEIANVAALEHNE